MSDLEQEAATWVPPWQRASDDASDVDDHPDDNDSWCEVEPTEDDDPADADSLALADPAEPELPEAIDLSEATERPESTELPVARGWSPSDVVARQPAPVKPDPQDDDAEQTQEAETADDAEESLDDAAMVEAARIEAAPVEPAPVEPAAEEKAEAGTNARVKKAGAEARVKAAAKVAAEDEEVRAEMAAALLPGQRVSEEDTPIEPLEPHEIAPALEAILMVVDEPVTEILLAQVLEIPAEDVASALIELSAGYTRDGKGFDLRRAAGGWRFYTRADYSAYVERFVLDGQQLRLTQASLETLAVVAYKQPVTRSRISAIRGVNVDGVIRTLVTRGMVEECGTDPDSGAHLYRTTNLFLEKLGLDSVEQLPALAPFLPDNLDEMEAA